MTVGDRDTDRCFVNTQWFPVPLANRLRKQLKMTGSGGRGHLQSKDPEDAGEFALSTEVLWILKGQV